MLDFQQFNPKYYLSGAIVVGFFEIIDGVAALLGYTSSIATAFSLLEIAWLPVSILFLIVFKKCGRKQFIPMIYILYMLYGWFVGSYLISNALPGESFILPFWFVVSATCFGLVYFLSSFMTYWRWYVVKT